MYKKILGGNNQKTRVSAPYIKGQNWREFYKLHFLLNQYHNRRNTLPPLPLEGNWEMCEGGFQLSQLEGLTYLLGRGQQ